MLHYPSRPEHCEGSGLSMTVDCVTDWSVEVISNLQDLRKAYVSWVKRSEATSEILRFAQN